MSAERGANNRMITQLWVLVIIISLDPVLPERLNLTSDLWQQNGFLNANLSNSETVFILGHMIICLISKNHFHPPVPTQWVPNRSD